ncbi:MAG TPA: sugar phosphate isomerase/epimerase [Longimicrobiaceae bacterium]
MSHQQTSRRAFMKTAVAGAAGAALGLPRAGWAATPAGPPADALKLGVASYSLRQFPRAEAIEMVKALRTPYINIKSFHLPYELSPAELQAGRREFEAAGLQIVGGGTITFEEDTDAGVKKYFDYAKGAGMPLMVSTANPAILPRIEKFAKEYDIRVAIHNHGPEDRHYPSPYDVLKHIGTMDARMGLCVDVGHTVRAGTDVVQALKDAGPRVLDLHMKDLTDLTDRDSQVIVGEGNIPIPDIFRQLLAMNYQGHVNLEYEIDARDPLPGMKQSFAYMRGVLAGIVKS